MCSCSRLLQTALFSLVIKCSNNPEPSVSEATFSFWQKLYDELGHMYGCVFHSPSLLLSITLAPFFCVITHSRFSCVRSVMFFFSRPSCAFPVSCSDPAATVLRQQLAPTMVHLSRVMVERLKFPDGE